MNTIVLLMAQHMVSDIQVKCWSHGQQYQGQQADEMGNPD